MTIAALWQEVRCPENETICPSCTRSRFGLHHVACEHHDHADGLSRFTDQPIAGILPDREVKLTIAELTGASWHLRLVPDSAPWSVLWRGAAERKR